MVEFGPLAEAYEQARRQLLAEAEPHRHWIGALASSALATATAVSALSLVARHAKPDGGSPWGAPEGRQQLNDLIFAGMRWLAANVNADGGWGDTDKSLSNIATTFLVRAAFHLTAVPAKHADLLTRAADYTRAQGDLDGLRRRYGRDKTFAVPILTNCALAGIVPWREVSPLPFELACVPQKFFRFLRLPVVSYAIPALVAIGQCRYFHRPPLNPVLRWLRRRAVPKSLRVLEEIQPASGGYLEATPLTSFVVMSLASMDLVENPVTQRGVEFLIRSARADGSWPIDSNLATWNTSLALNALATSDSKSSQSELVPWLPECLDWLLSCQHRAEHPFTGAKPGGWGWSDLSGAVPDADDTAGAMLALCHYRTVSCESQNGGSERTSKLEAAVAAGAQWLLGLQNSDGGWPTFCRGWGTLPFDRSAADLTAHAIRALYAGNQLANRDSGLRDATERGFAYLQKQQRPDGSWVPLWFGNQYHPEEKNPIYGTSRVLLAYRDLGRLDSPEAKRGLDWLVRQQNLDGGWGATPAVAVDPKLNGAPQSPIAGVRSSVEETALALEALASITADSATQAAVEKGLAWLVQAVETNRFRECSPIGFYFAKLWYYEQLYPLTFTVSALGQAIAHWRPAPDRIRIVPAQPELPAP